MALAVNVLNITEKSVQSTLTETWSNTFSFLLQLFYIKIDECCNFNFN